MPGSGNFIPLILIVLLGFVGGFLRGNCLWFSLPLISCTFAFLGVRRAALYLVSLSRIDSLASLKEHPFSALNLSIVLSSSYMGHCGERAVCPSFLQLGQKGPLLQFPSCGSSPH